MTIAQELLKQASSFDLYEDALKQRAQRVRRKRGIGAAGAVTGLAATALLSAAVARHLKKKKQNAA